MRKKLPPALEKKILVKNRHCCCICQHDGHGKEVMIHHIDGNNRNNEPFNLAVLCLIHSSVADAGLKKGKLGSGKKLKPEEVKEFKKIWERKIELENKVVKRRMPVYKKKQLEILFHFEIRKTIDEIVSLNDNDKRLKEKFAYLDQFYFEEIFSNLNLRKMLLEAYSDIAVQTIERVELPKRVSKSILDLFLHLVGPEDVPIIREDRVLFSEGLKILETLGKFSAEFNRLSVLEKICEALYSFGEIATWYGLKSEKAKIYRIMTSIKKECLDFESEGNSEKIKKERRERQSVVDRYYRKLKKV